MTAGQKAYRQQKKDLDELQRLIGIVFLTSNQKRRITTLAKRIYRYVDTYTAATPEEKATAKRYLDSLRTW